MFYLTGGIKQFYPNHINSNPGFLTTVRCSVPEIGGVDFVEFYNRSDKVFNLGDLLLANRDERDSIDKVQPVFIDYLIFPEDYAVITPDPADIQARYDCRHLEPLAECSFNPFALISNPLPTYPDKEGTVVVYLPSVEGAAIIDEFYYEDDYHYELIDDLDGVSLERIDPDGNSQDPNNWHSGAELFGFATPTYRNSQFFVAEPEGNDIFTLSSKTVSPDGDGFEDFLLLNYEVDQIGYTTNIDVFDIRGRLVKKLVRNELLAEGGFFQWDGATDSGEKARIGIYVIWIELFNPSGEVEHFKLPCVVAAKLD